MVDISKLNTVELTEKLVAAETKFNELKENDSPGIAQAGKDLERLEAEASRRTSVEGSLSSGSM